jgi:tripartite-type tricarboxylate transporter receptor subunit TctC
MQSLSREKEQFSMKRLRSVALLFALAITSPLSAMAADWPNRPVHFIVPFSAGGSTDVAARIVGDYLSRTIGQQVVVENKSGANGNIGIEYAAKSTPDGYTILIGTDAVSSNPHVYKMDFDPLKELVPADMARCKGGRRLEALRPGARGSNDVTP